MAGHREIGTKAAASAQRRPVKRVMTATSAAHADHAGMAAALEVLRHPDSRFTIARQNGIRRWTVKKGWYEPTAGAPSTITVLKGYHGAALRLILDCLERVGDADWHYTEQNATTHTVTYGLVLPTLAARAAFVAAVRSVLAGRDVLARLPARLKEDKMPLIVPFVSKAMDGLSTAAFQAVFVQTCKDRKVTLCTR